MAILDDKLRIMAITEWPGVVQGTLANNTARNTNRININAAIVHCYTFNKALFWPPGTYEIHGGGVIVNHEQFYMFGTQSTIILQYQLDAPVMHIGGALGGPGITFATTIRGFFLRYAGVAGVGGNALEVGGSLYRCVLGEFLIGDPYQTLAGRTSVPWEGVHIDQLAGTVASFSNTFHDFHIKHFGYRGWSQFRDDYSASTGNVYSNIYIGNGDATGRGDVSGVGGSAVYFGSLGQAIFNQLNVEWIESTRPLHFEVCGETILNSVNLEGIVLKAGSLQDMGLVYYYQGDSEWHGVTVNDCTFDTANNVQNPSIFRMSSSTRIRVSTIRVFFTNKTASDLVCFRGINPAGESDIHVDLGNFNPTGTHLVDRVDGLVLTDGGAGFGAIPDFTSQTPRTLTDASQTVYAFRMPTVLLISPSVPRVITLSRQLSAAETTRIPRGTPFTVHNVTGSASTVTVDNYEGTDLIAGMAAGETAKFSFDGDDWLRVG
jgi:hypothetical protein